ASGSGGAELARPRPGGRVQLSGKLCLTCCLPFNWPGESVAPPSTIGGTSQTVGKSTGVASAVAAAASAMFASTESGRSGGGGGGGISSGIISGPALRTKTLATAGGGGERWEREERRRDQEHQWRRQQELQQELQQNPSWPDPSLDELSVILDEASLMLAVPDPPYSPLHGGLLLCVAPLRNTAAKVHPANPRVLELRVSTREEGQPGSSGGPGLFLPVPVGQTAGSGIGDGGGGAGFRGAAHAGVWHLVLSFKSAGACRLVAEHVEERRDAILAFRTVGLVEMFRRVAAMATNNNTGIFI
ncbi:unnamed protein product, partial [Hapterophycus canaliculatus]